jgi:hypothetical protein
MMDSVPTVAARRRTPSWLWLLPVGGLVWWVWRNSPVARPAPAANIAR